MCIFLVGRLCQPVSSFFPRLSSLVRELLAGRKVTEALRESTGEAQISDKNNNNDDTELVGRLVRPYNNNNNKK